MQTSQLNKKERNIFMFVAFLGLIFTLNYLSQITFFRIDLTKEKLYTLSDQTKDILTNLDEIIYIKVYLDGELTIPLKKFQRSVKEMLDEFKAYGGSNVNYEFIDPLENTDKQNRDKILTGFARKGLPPKNSVFQAADGTKTERYIIPGALVVYKEYEAPVNLLEDNSGRSGEQNINISTVNLEYKLINTIRNLSQKETHRIVLLEGHGELPDPEVGDFIRELSKSYAVDRGEINGRAGVMDGYAAVIIAQPKEKFSEADKFCIDQYIMQGGKVIWLVDGVTITLDSIADGETIAYPNDLNLDDMFFRYGVRFNYNLVQDLQCNFIPINMALTGNTPNFQPVSWPYFPLYTMPTNTVITKNLNMVWSQFPGSIDTIGNRDKVTITPLLVTSPATKSKNVPEIVSLSEWQDVNNPNDYQEGEKVTAVLIEGNLNSVFKNRITSEYEKPDTFQFHDHIENGQLAILADGDLIRNDVRYTSNGPLVSPLGYDRYTQQTFGNKEFLMNLVHYMTDKNNLLNLKNKNIVIRLLDRSQIMAERKKWQIINLITPLLLTIILAVSFYFIRRHKYAQ